MEGTQYSITRVYEDIEPSEEWAREETHDTLIVYLPGFRKENLKIQVTSTRNVRVLGERPVGHDNKWQRFRREFPIPSNCDTNDISARFETGLLYVKLPKMITPAVEKKDQVLPPKAPTEAPKAGTQAPKPPTEAPKAGTQDPKPLKEAPQPPPIEAPKAPTQAPKPPKEAPKPPPTEAPKTQTPISNYNDYQEQNKKSNGSQESWKSSDFVLPKTTEKEKERETIAEPVAQKPVEKEKKITKITEKVEEKIGKSVEDSTREEYKRAIFGGGDEKNNCGVADKFCRPAQGFNCRQVVDGFSGLVMEMKQQPRKLVNLGLAILFILVLGWYVKSAFNAIQEFTREEL